VFAANAATAAAAETPAGPVDGSHDHSQHTMSSVDWSERHFRQRSRTTGRATPRGLPPSWPVWWRASTLDWWL